MTVLPSEKKKKEKKSKKKIETFEIERAQNIKNKGFLC
jgi:hypothetical protein